MTSQNTPKRSTATFHGQIDKKDVEKMLTELSLFPDREKVTGAKVYELLHHTLGNQLRLVRPILQNERIKLNSHTPTQIAGYGSTAGPQLTDRIIGVLWFGKTYQRGMVIEVFGTDLHQESIELARAIIKALGGEVPVVCRELKNRYFE